MRALPVFSVSPLSLTLGSVPISQTLASTCALCLFCQSVLLLSPPFLLLPSRPPTRGQLLRLSFSLLSPAHFLRGCVRARLCVSSSFSGSCPCLAFRLFLMPSRFCVSASHCLCRLLVRALMRLPLMLSCLPTFLPQSISLTISVGPRCTCSVSLAECVSLTVSASLQLSCHRVSLSGSVSQRLPSLAALALNFSDPLPSVSLPVSLLQLLSSLRLKFSPYHYLPVSLRIYSVSPDYLCLCVTQTLSSVCT